MESLPIGYFDNFREIGMESYAMEDSLRRVGKAISARASGDKCGEVSEILIASSIWSEKVELSSRASAVEVELFDHLERILENGSDYAGEGC